MTTTLLTCGCGYQRSVTTAVACKQIAWLRRGGGDTLPSNVTARALDDVLRFVAASDANEPLTVIRRDCVRDAKWLEHILPPWCVAYVVDVLPDSAGPLADVYDAAMALGMRRLAILCCVKIADAVQIVGLGGRDAADDIERRTGYQRVTDHALAAAYPTLLDKLPWLDTPPSAAWNFVGDYDDDAEHSVMLHVAEALTPPTGPCMPCAELLEKCKQLFVECLSEPRLYNACMHQSTAKKLMVAIARGDTPPDVIVMPMARDVALCIPRADAATAWSDGTLGRTC